MDKTTILICDDHPIFRQGLISIIKGDDTLKLVGECGDGICALKTIKKCQPDITILDISLPKKNGLEVARLLNNNGIITKPIILTMYNDKEYFYESMDIGIKGYLLKENVGDDLLNCIKYVKSGKYYITSHFSDQFAEYIQRSFLSKLKLNPIKKLSKSEIQVLFLMANNNCNKEIADQLYISTRTVHNHCQNIYKKLNIYGQNKLFQFAIENKDILSFY